MTKEQFLNKWNGTSPFYKADLEAVIAHEIAKVQPEKTNKIEITPHTLVEINRAFRALKQDRNSYVHKVFSDDGVFDAMNEISEAYKYYFGEQPQEKPTLNPIEQAYERGEKIRHKNWLKSCWIKKHSETETIDERGNICYNDWSFVKHPNKWELYTEPAEQVAKPTEQPAKPFDKERFEAMFRAVVANGGHELDHKQAIELTEEALAQLDAFYAEKQGGNNE